MFIVDVDYCYALIIPYFNFELYDFLEKNWTMIPSGL